MNIRLYRFYILNSKIKSDDEIIDEQIILYLFRGTNNKIKV
jgi:hypothetical protein